MSANEERLMKTQSLPREIQSMNKDWRFALGEFDGAELPSFDDSRWRRLDVPHDWSIEGPFEENNPSGPRGGYAPAGVGWYRKSFRLEERHSNKNVFVQFDGIYMNSEVWINGNFLGRYPYGYTSLEYDLSAYLNSPGEVNVLAVKVDNELQPGSRWYSGSGIYRSVRFVMTERLHIPRWGVCVRASNIQASTADVYVLTSVSHTGDKAVSFSLISRIVNRDGSIVAESRSNGTIRQGETLEFVQETAVPEPHRWSLEDPAMYKLLSLLMVGGMCSDVYETPFGIREAVFDPERGFLLNGQVVKLKGVCLHHDGGCLGAACLKRTWERQLEIVRQMGCNAIRTSHNPPAPEILELCDTMGLLVMDEAFDEWKVGKSPRIFSKENPDQVIRLPIYSYYRLFEQWAEKDLTAMIERDRNHPSIVLWCIGNEIRDTRERDGAETAVMLRDIAHRLDPTRPVTMAIHNFPRANDFGTAQQLDVVGYNYKERLYVDEHREYPERCIVGSENRSAAPFEARGNYEAFIRDVKASDRGVSVYAGLNELIGVMAVGDLTQANAYERYVQAQYSWAITDRLDFVSGLFLWTGFDYIGEPTPYCWPSKSSSFGISDLCGFPKDAYFLYQSLWTDQPMLHLFPHWNWPDKEGETIPVWCFSNCDGVELFVNGMSAGYQERSEATYFHLEWQATYRPGALKAVGYKAGIAVLTKEIHTAAEPHQVRLMADRTVMNAQEQDLVYITVRIEDSRGNIVPVADHPIRLEVTGEGEIAGVDNGNPEYRGPFQGNTLHVFNGLGLVVIKNSGSEGMIVIKADSPSLQACELTLQNACQ